MPVPVPEPSKLKGHAAMRAALEKIAKWFGEFPPSGRTWDDEPRTPLSFGMCWGSNGERDYMREVARLALEAADTATPDAAYEHALRESIGSILSEHSAKLIMERAAAIATTHAATPTRPLVIIRGDGGAFSTASDYVNLEDYRRLERELREMTDLNAVNESGCDNALAQYAKCAKVCAAITAALEAHLSTPSARVQALDDALHAALMICRKDGVPHG